MINKQKVSVILCNYNYAAYLSAAIESVINQTYKNFELIIVDDGSTDNSREIIENYQDSRIISIFKKNGGQASAFNAGFLMAAGEYIAFLDSDDVWKEDKLFEVVNNFNRYQNISAVQHPLEIIDCDNQRKNILHPPALKPGLENILKKYFLKNHTIFFSATSGIAAHREILTKIFPLDESWEICADVLFTRPLPIFGKILTLTEPLGFYRIHDSNNWMNTDGQSKFIENQSKYNDYVNEWLNKLGIDKQLDFKKSRIYQEWRLNEYSSYYPKRLMLVLWRIYTYLNYYKANVLRRT